MITNEESFSLRLESFTSSTIQLILDLTSISREKARKTLDIVSDDELTEEQVIKKLNELKEDT